MHTSLLVVNCAVLFIRDKPPPNSEKTVHHCHTGLHHILIIAHSYGVLVAKFISNISDHFIILSLWYLLKATYVAIVLIDITSVFYNFLLYS